MFEFFESLKQSRVFGQQFDYEDERFIVVFATGLTKNKQTEDEPETEWVFACKTGGNIPAPLYIVPCEKSQMDVFPFMETSK